jgi:xanthine/CO dehydrogenase XdhC/CoxF family maturation factor
MSVMPDLAELVAAADRLRAEGARFVIATVVRVSGSSYRRPGARMIVSEQGRVAGSVSGGCLEGNLVRTAFWRTEHGPAIVTFDSSDPDDADAALGCGGVVDILLERGGPDDALAVAARSLAAGTRATMITMADGRHHLAESNPDAVLVETIAPPLALFVLGSGVDAVPVADAAARIGWRVHVWNAAGRAELATRFPRAVIDGPDLDGVRAQIDRAEQAAVLVMSHDARRDRPALAMALASRAAYIGVLGPRHRTLELAAHALDDPRVHAPVGLDLGAETPEEIAIAIVAEVMAVVRGTSAARLRTRPAIHTSSRAIDS